MIEKNKTEYRIYFNVHGESVILMVLQGANGKLNLIFFLNIFSFDIQSQRRRNAMNYIKTNLPKVNVRIEDFEFHYYNCNIIK